MAKRRPGAGEREVVALGEIFRRDRRAIEPAQAGGNLPGVQAGGIDDEIGLEFGGFASAGSQLNLAAGYRGGDDRRAENGRAAGCVGVGLVGQHQRMAVDNPGARRKECARAMKLRLQTGQTRGADAFDSLNLIAFGALQQMIEIGCLPRDWSRQPACRTDDKRCRVRRNSDTARAARARKTEP